MTYPNNVLIRIREGDAISYTTNTKADGSGSFSLSAGCDKDYTAEITCPDGKISSLAINTRGEGGQVDASMICDIAQTENQSKAKQIVDFVYMLIPLLLLLFLMFIVMIFVGIIEKITGG